MNALALEVCLSNAWRKRNLLFYGVLLPLSWLFDGISYARRWVYQQGIFKSHALPVPVVIVGNISVGGTGKTPIVIAMLEQLKQAGYRPGVISRGYGAQANVPIQVTATSDPQHVGDEPVLIAQRSLSPVWVCRNRVQAGMDLLKAHPDCNVIVSDDGLQHYALQRQVEIAVVDAQTFRHARLLPAGRLREPIARLQTVDIVISNGECDWPSAYAMQLTGAQFYNLRDPKLSASAVDFVGKTIRAMAGIGRPERFFEHLRQLGLTFSTSIYEDHHAYVAEDLAAMDSDIVLMTEKDAVKCKPFAQAHHWVLPVQAELDPACWNALFNLLARK